jgi:hypothetical protein
MPAIHDRIAAAAGDDRVVDRGRRITQASPEKPAKASEFAGRDQQSMIDEFIVAIADADGAGVDFIRGSIMSRMEAGDLSSLAALRLLRTCDAREAAIGRPR